MNEFKICDICNEEYVLELEQELKKIDENAVIAVGCHGLCGIGASMVFVIVNGIPVTGDSVMEVINKVKVEINK